MPALGTETIVSQPRVMEFAHMAIVPYDPDQSAFPFDGGDAVMRRVARQIALRHRDRALRACQCIAHQLVKIVHPILMSRAERPFFIDSRFEVFLDQRRDPLVLL